MLQNVVSTGADWFAGFKEKVGSCTRCSISSTCKSKTISYGILGASLVVVGEGPGYVEDCTGNVFCGYEELLDSDCIMCANIDMCFSWFYSGNKSLWDHIKCRGWSPTISKPALLKVSSIKTAGQVLDDALLQSNLMRSDVYTTNVVMCRAYELQAGKPVNRKPKPSEILNCVPYLIEHLENANPKVLVALGEVAAKLMVPNYSSITLCRGKKYDYNLLSIPCPLVVSWHPSYILRGNDSALYELIADIKLAASIAYPDA